jgi:hypothetical protein
MEERPPIGFALAILPQLDFEGRIASYRVHAQNNLQEEVVLTLVRAWLRREEDNHFEAFKAGS